MNFLFDAKRFKAQLEQAVANGIEASPLVRDVENSPERLLAAMAQAIDVMERAESDVATQNDIGEKDITEIGDYVLTLIEGLLGHAQARTDTQGETQVRALMRLTLPVAMWVAKCGGRLDKLDLVVNALADYANELREPEQLADLTAAIGFIIQATSDAVQKDLEQTNTMRPWRVLHLNYGIVATRSHDPELIETAYDVLAKNLPHDARQFFREGMQQMDIVGYPQAVRDVVEKYNQMWGSENTLH